MFNLENEIKNWKKSLKKNRGFEDGYIEELESHLIDSFNELKKKYRNEQDAFQMAVGSLGTGDKIAKDYLNINSRGINKMKVIFFPSWQNSLLANYFKLGFRNILKHKVYSFINIVGLALGLAILILMGLVTRDEIAFDKFNVNKDRIYRAITNTERNGQRFIMAPVVLPFEPAAVEEISEIEKGVRLKIAGRVIKKDEKKINERIVYTSPELFDVFSFNVISGDIYSALTEPNSMAISSSYADKYFGDENPVGQTLLVHNVPNKVAAVFEDMPFLSHFRENILISFSTYENQENNYANSWGNTGNDYTYFLLKENVDPSVVQNKFKTVLQKYLSEEQAAKTEIMLQPLGEIHFSDLNYDFAETTPVMVVYAFSAISLFILLIACVNFINLATARATERAREVGLRKVTGATRLQLIRQFLLECILMSTVALLIALLLVKLILPGVNAITHKIIDFNSVFQWHHILFLAGVTILTGLLAGIYPALSLSRYEPVKVLRSGIVQTVKGVRLRSVLVVSQFVISVILIIGNITIMEQIDFMKSKDLGFRSKDLTVLRTYDPALKKNIKSFKEKLKSSEYVFNAASSSGTPASGSSSTSNFIAGGAEEGNEVYMQRLSVDEDFFETYKVLFAQGRDFKKEISTDSDNACIINETAAAKLNWVEPIGQELQMGGEEKKYRVIGVVKDFHYSSVNQNIKPSIYFLNSEEASFLTVHINPLYKNDAMEFIKTEYDKFASLYPLRYYSIETEMSSYLGMEDAIFRFLGICTILALFVSCLGILGLVSFTVNKKRKEIGIRKVMGASDSQIFKNISGEFLKWITVSNLIAWPAAYLLMNQWLQNYTYRIEFNYFTFAAAALATILITYLTISYQSYKAARENPIESLKYE